MKALLVPRLARWWADAGPPGPPGQLVPRWIFLRALGVIYFSAFYSLVFQIRELLGPQGFQQPLSVRGAVGVLEFARITA